MKASKLLTNCFAALQLSQFYPASGMRGASAPLLPHVGAQVNNPFSHLRASTTCEMAFDSVIIK